MVANPDIGTGSSQQRPEDRYGLWEELSLKLNSTGPKIRDVPAWKKVSQIYDTTALIYEWSIINAFNFGLKYIYRVGVTRKPTQKNGN